MIALFCCRLICGASLCWLVMPRKQVTDGFFRIQHLVVLGLSVLSALTVVDNGPFSQGKIPDNPAATSRALLILIAAIAYVGSVLWTLGRRSPGRVAMLAILILSFPAVLGLQALTWTYVTNVRVLSIINEVSSIWLIGTAVTGMLLGHWYLTATSMPLEPLIRLNQFFLSASLLRAVIAGVGLATCPEPVTETTHLVWLMLRWLSGIVGPFLMSILIWRILKYRNTQSATGVFFAGVILVFLGEMAATLLSNEVAFPL
ncbi:MAG: hypothetical protein KDA93_22455 [Planctomycetaceae bacterium]|nr:hypothetical protein [Planctomycetaceae bacterium]